MRTCTTSAAQSMLPSPMRRPCRRSNTSPHERASFPPSPTHAVASLRKLAPTMGSDQLLVVTISVRGDKDCAAIARDRGEDLHEDSATDHGKAFIAFLTCDDPDLETTAAAVRAAAQNGADSSSSSASPSLTPRRIDPSFRPLTCARPAKRRNDRQDFRSVRELRRGVTIPMVFRRMRMSSFLRHRALFVQLPRYWHRRAHPAGRAV